ncbi:MAG TPA: 4a-hydroxytetrahydrobiopterin dehydratase [Phycisphaerales bacterium]|nr:4a-hydroxytetrahydrobiopterin dehydratase [Phycisphaerales bacterium]
MAAKASKPPAKLSAEQVAQRVAAMPQWAEVAGSIQRTFQFKDFVEAMKFVNRVADVAEKAQHHPDILIRWNKVTLSLNTHDAGGITQKDFDLAGQIDRM